MIRLLWLGGVLGILTTGTLAAQDGGTVAGLVPPRPAGFVTDRAGVLDPVVAQRVEQRLARLREVTGAEVVVVTLPWIGDAAPADIGLAIGRAWGVGAQADVGDRRRNASAVLLLVPRTDSTRGRVDLRSGTGAEGFLTDALAGQILDAIIPLLGEGRYGEAIDEGTARLADLFARELGVQDTALVRPRQESGGRNLLPVILVVLIV
ncbi:MAG: hypothetical protein CVV20_03620, partial [Gemmatimonadetes bacterium HGW-Gemmatimonadetes-1]